MSKNRTFSDYERKTVYAKANGKCRICGKPIDFEKFTVDHKIPLSKGGGNNFPNLQATCKSCNLMKHYLTHEEFLKKLFEVTKHNLWNIFKLYVKGGAGA